MTPPVDPISGAAHLPLAELSPNDAAALDRLAERGFTDPQDETERRLLALLDLLDAEPPSDRAARVEAVHLLVRRAAESESVAPELHPLDQEALDALVNGGHRLDRVPRSLRQRAEVAAAIGRVLTQTEPAVDFSADLADRTLARIQEEVDAESESLRFDRHRLTAPSVRWADLVSIAAVFLLCASVLWPVLQAGRSQARRFAATAQLGSVASAFGAYAEDHGGAMPVATPQFEGSWMQVGQAGRSNSANLYTIIRAGYAPIDRLASPGNPNAPTKASDPEARDWGRLLEVSYSYRLLPAHLRSTWASDRQPSATPVLADRSPVTLATAEGRTTPPDANSPNFDGLGQHVLFEDGSVAFLESPVVNGDNIWLPAVIEKFLERIPGRVELKGDMSEIPNSPADVFLGP